MNATTSLSHPGSPAPAGPQDTGTTKLVPETAALTDRRLLPLATIDPVRVATASLAAGERLRIEGSAVVLAGALGLGHTLASREIEL